MIYPTGTRMHWLFGVLLLVSLGGCSQGDYPEIVSVKGQVTLNGEPVEKAEVLFQNEFEGGRPASAVTDADGRFTLRTYFDPRHNPEGVIPGTYSVTVTKFVSPYADLSEEERIRKIEADDQAGRDTRGKNVLSNRYASKETSDLSFDLREAQNDLKIELRQ